MKLRPADTSPTINLQAHKYLTITDDHYAIDLEGDALQATRLWCAYVYHFNTSTWTELIGHEAIKAFVLERPTAYWVGHNVLSWDGPVLNRLLSVGIRLHQLVDTLILGQLYWPKIPRPEGLSGKKGPHSLEAWGLRFNLPKGDFDDFSQLTPEMLTYCKQDVVICAKLYRTLVKRMGKQGFSELSCWIEHYFRHVVNEQQARGFWFDKQGAEELFAQLRKEEHTLGEHIRQVFTPKRKEAGRYKYRTKADGEPYASYIRHQLEFGDAIEFHNDGTYSTYVWEPFNIGSPAQRLERMLEAGYKPTKKTKNGNPSIDEDSLVEFAKSSGIKEVQMMADWLVANGRANMIGTWLNNLDADSRIRGDVWTCGAATRRCTHSNPNSANIPGEGAKYGHECRALWGIPHEQREARLLVGVDAKALEMRMFAHYLGNEEAIKLYCFGDPHQVNADLLGLPRRVVKGIFYAFAYGASDSKLSTTAGFPKNSRWGKQARSKLVDGTPGLKALVRQLETEFKTGFIQTIDGGFVRCHSEHTALNYKLQSAGAILMKLACILLFFEIKAQQRDVWFVGNIHDEWQLDCSVEDADWAAEMGPRCIQVAGELLGFDVPTDGDSKKGFTWHETH